MTTTARTRSPFAAETSLEYLRAEPLEDHVHPSPGTSLYVRDEPKRRHLAIDPRLRPTLPTLTAIVDLELLEPNWDGHGAARTTMTAIQTAIQVFAAHPRLLRPPAVIPRPDGGVHLEWTDVAPCLELGIEPDGVVTLLVQRGEDWDDHEFPSPGDHDLHELLGLVET